MAETVSSEGQNPGAVLAILNALGLDAYTTQARLMPALVVVLPLSLTTVSLFPEKLLTVSLAVGVVSTLALMALFSELGRDAGKKKQDTLWKSWGGPPSIRMLRHRDKSITQETRLRYHSKLGKLLNLTMPTAEDEKANQGAADKIYKTCGDYLLEKTRDAKKFALILKENISYGFRRNLWGMKPTGLVLSALGVLVCGGVAAYQFTQSKMVLPVPTIAACLCAMLLTFWLFRINPEWVRMAADAYAKRLLAACEDLDFQPVAEKTLNRSAEAAQT